MVSLLIKKSIKVLRYINKREQVKKETLIKKFGEDCIRALSNHTKENPSFIFEEFEEIETEPTWPPGWGPSTNIERNYLGICKLTPEGADALESAKVKARDKWVKAYIPIIISILMLIVTFLLLLCD